MRLVMPERRAGYVGYSLVVPRLRGPALIYSVTRFATGHNFRSTVEAMGTPEINKGRPWIRLRRYFIAPNCQNKKIMGNN